ncbi:MAG: alpha/beta hydrolase [Lachnospiraceae bacterium]
MRIRKYVLNEKYHTDITAYLQDNYRVDSKEMQYPAVLICPGGAFFSLSEREGAPVAAAFLNRGFQAFVLHYTIGNCNHKITNILEDALTDCAMAVHTIKEHAKEFHIDSERILMLGFSAGAYLTAMYGNRWKEAWLTEKVGVQPKELKIRTAALCYPLCDYEMMSHYENQCSKETHELLLKANLCLCGEQFPPMETRRKYSPLRYVCEDTVPTFLWHTSDDHVVPAENSLSYARQLSKFQIPYELHIFEHGVHGMSLALPHTAAVEEEINDHCAAWFGLLMKWLEKRRDFLKF